MLFPVERRPAAVALFLGGVIVAVFAALVLRYDHHLREVIRGKMIQRDAAVLTSVAQQEVETGALTAGDANPGRWLAALLPAAHRQGLLAMAIFDADGIPLGNVPASQLFVELPVDDFIQLQDGRPLTRYWPDFSLRKLFPSGPIEPKPVLEIVLPLRAVRAAPGSAAGRLIGFVRYHLDARALAGELATLDASVGRQTSLTLTFGLVAFSLLAGTAYTLLRRAQRTIAERTLRLQRANFELTLSAKASALGQLTSHLVHGLQGSVAGLRAAVASRDARSPRDWETAAGYAEQMQLMIQEIVGLLGDTSSASSYELTGRELADIIRRRNAPAATAKGVELQVNEGFPEGVDSHRGGLLCLIASNLVQNAIEATAPADQVTVVLHRDEKKVTLTVTDEGPGIPAELREHLFEPGRSGRPGGTGLGLAISQLLARQIGAALVLDASTPDGAIFRVTLPVSSGATVEDGPPHPRP